MAAQRGLCRTWLETLKTGFLVTGFMIMPYVNSFIQASLDSELGKTKGSLTGFVSLCREILSRFVEQYFPTRIDNPVRKQFFMKSFVSGIDMVHNYRTICKFSDARNFAVIHLKFKQRGKT